MTVTLRRANHRPNDSVQQYSVLRRVTIGRTYTRALIGFRTPSRYGFLSRVFRTLHRMARSRVFKNDIFFLGRFAREEKKKKKILKKKFTFTAQGH